MQATEGECNWRRAQVARIVKLAKQILSGVGVDIYIYLCFRYDDYLSHNVVFMAYLADVY